MKKVLFFTLFVVLLTACGTNSQAYSNLLSDEKQLIEDYIKREHIEIIYEEPAYSLEAWGENKYLEVADNCYFRLTKLGDTLEIIDGDTLEIEPIKAGDRVQMRYRAYTLKVNADTVYYWTTNDSPYPVEFRYLDNGNQSCEGWHYALRYMRYSGAEGKLICPSKKGFADDIKNVTPKGYDLKFKIKRF